MNCPYCSAPVKPNWPTYPPEPKDGISWFTCGTMIQAANPNRGDQTRLCVEEEVARLKARVQTLREAGLKLLAKIDWGDITVDVDALREVVEAKP